MSGARAFAEQIAVAKEEIAAARGPTDSPFVAGVYDMAPELLDYYASALAERSHTPEAIQMLVSAIGLALGVVIIAACPLGRERFDVQDAADALRAAMRAAIKDCPR